MLNWIKWKLCGKELEELHRYRIKVQEYRQWLGEFREIALTLDNLDAVVKGEVSVYTQYTDGVKGPYTINALREYIRKLKRGKNAD